MVGTGILFGGNTSVAGPFTSVCSPWWDLDSDATALRALEIVVFIRDVLTVAWIAERSVFLHRRRQDAAQRGGSGMMGQPDVAFQTTKLAWKWWTIPLSLVQLFENQVRNVRCPTAILKRKSAGHVAVAFIAHFHHHYQIVANVNIL